MKRLTLIALLLAAPVGLWARLSETSFLTPAASRTAPDPAAEWRPITGPATARPEPANDPSPTPGLTVHEWGTFTSIAGPDGRAMQWVPAGGPTDLPCFVAVDGVGPKIGPIAELGGRSLNGKVRMETPVLYFYSQEEQTVNVKVRFPHGMITEWFPDTKERQAGSYIRQKPGEPDIDATIRWSGVKVQPGATATYRIDDRPSHYYAARRTGAAPLKVGEQSEKFLFYRGIGDFAPPLAARPETILRSGRIETSAIEITNLAEESMPGIVLFENRAGRIGYRIARNVHGAIHLDRPELNGSFDSIQTDLEGLLESQGMYPREARAMVDTWRDSWFEQGVRVFYILPSTSVASILPLEVDPKPARVARAFVGRMEVFTPDLQEQIRSAVVQNDKATLETYGRFIEPVVNVFLAGRLSPVEAASAKKAIGILRATYVESAKACTEKRSW